MYTGTGVQTINRAVGRMDAKMSMLIKLVFEEMASPDEQKLSKFIQKKGRTRQI